MFSENDLQIILQRYLMNGRLGQFILGRGSYIYQDVNVETGKFRNDLIFSLLLLMLSLLIRLLMAELKLFTLILIYVLQVCLHTMDD